MVLAVAVAGVVGFTVTRTPSPTASPAPEVEIGFSLSEIVGMGRGETAELLDTASAAGATTVRFDIAWSTVEPTEDGPEDWAVVDRAVAALRDRGLRLLPVVGYTPPWARDAGCDVLTCPPASADRFARFVGDVVHRYDGPDVAAWEVWNEPNAAYWTPAPDPARYAALLRAASGAVDAVGSGAPVLTGGLAPAVDGRSTMAPDRFLDAVYAAGGRGAFDGVAMHPYSFPALPGEGQPWSGWTQMDRLRDVMVAQGDDGLDVWATELGAPTAGSGARASLERRRYPEEPDHVDPELQAATVTAVFAAARERPWLRAIVWYSLVDLPAEHGGSAVDLRGYGLIDRDLDPKPSWAAWRRAVEELTAGR